MDLPRPTSSGGLLHHGGHDPETAGLLVSLGQEQPVRGFRASAAAAVAAAEARVYVASCALLCLCFLRAGQAFVFVLCFRV